MSPVEPAQFTGAMANVPSPVTIVTTQDETGRRWGFTASSFTALSLDPPLVLVCLAKTASSHAPFLTAERFLVNVLSCHQAELATRFARTGEDKFAVGAMTSCELSLPGLPGATARLACTVHEIVDGGDHSILIGRVEKAYAGRQEPLIYHRRSFTRPETVPALAGAR